ncbi:MAG: pyrimidine reductase family protein [Pseudonocardiales bacterium]|nr:MAG: pyrimidine reductase family protein [Pseudonocardiales bacterium]
MRELLPRAGEVDLFAAYAQADPGLRVNFVSSADGAAALDGRSDGLSGPADKLVFRVLRALADVIVVGAGTARIEGYGAVRLPAEHRDWRGAHGMPPAPPLAVVSRSLALDPASPMFTEADVRPLVLTGPDAPTPARQALAEVADLITGGSAAEWRALLAERGLTRILCEGGPRLFGSLLAEDLVDELCLTLSPVLARQEAPGIAEQPGGDGPVRLGLVHVLEDDGYLFLRYTVGRD